MSERIDILTPVGRLVQGDCFEPQTTDAENNPLTIKSGPNAGQPRVDYFMALAVPKTDPGLPALQAVIMNAAKQSFPTLFDATGNCVSPTFAFKMVDGDSAVPNSRGTKPCDREGFPGNVVLYFSSGFAPKCYTKGGTEVIVDPEAIKRGYFIRINGSVAGNGSSQRPGIFLNHNLVELVGYGEVINSGPDGATVFGGAPAGALPAGASATPLAGIPLAAPAGGVPGVVATPVTTAAPGVPAVAAVTPVSAVPVTTSGAPVATVTPALDFLNPPTPAVVKYVDSNGNAFTWDQLIAAGITAAQIAAMPQA